MLLLSSKAIFVVGTRFHLVRASATFCVAIASHGDFHQKAHFCCPCHRCEDANSCVGNAFGTCCFHSCYVHVTSLKATKIKLFTVSALVEGSICVWFGEDASSEIRFLGCEKTGILRMTGRVARVWITTPTPGISAVQIVDDVFLLLGNATHSQAWYMMCTRRTS